MIDIPDPLIILDAFKQVNLIARFLYEKDEDSNELSHYNTDLFGTTKSVYTVPIQDRNLAVEVLDVNCRKIKKENFNLTDDRSHTLAKLQLLLGNSLYKMQDVPSLEAYVRKLHFKASLLLNEQKCIIIAENYLELANSGYSYDLLDHRLSVVKREYEEELKIIITEPLVSWLGHILKIVENNTALKTIRTSITAFTGVRSPSKEIRKSRIENSFRMKKGQDVAKLKLIHEALIRSRLIGSETQQATFIAAFHGSSPSESIEWLGYIGELHQFISLLIERNFIHSDTQWETAALIFSKAKVNNLGSSLGTNHPTKNSARVDLIIDLLKS